MRKDLKKFIIYAIFVFVTGFSAYFYYGYYQSSQYDGTVIPYIQKVLPELSTWDPEVVKQYMAPEVLGTVTDKNGNPVINAVVFIQGTDMKQYTGKNGKYTLLMCLPANIIWLSVSRILRR